MLAPGRKHRESGKNSDIAPIAAAILDIAPDPAWEGRSLINR
jgi:hypothetical protein